MEREKIILKVSYLSIFVNCLLFVLKLIAGLVGNSIAMISDAVHSFSDIATTFIVIIGVKIAGKESDDDHPYGHERLEAVMSVILAVILLLVGFGIAEVGFESMLNLDDSGTPPTLIALVSAVVSIVLKELMFWVTYRIGTRVDSTMLKADAWHHRSDALSSIGSFIGIFGAMHGYIFLDGLASILISFVILKVSYDIFKDSFDRLVDKACDKNIIKDIEESILNIDGVVEISELKTRMFADKIFVEVGIVLIGSLTVKEGYIIAENVHLEVEQVSDKIKHCCVYIKPC